MHKKLGVFAKSDTKQLLPIKLFWKQNVIFIFIRMTQRVILSKMNVTDSHFYRTYISPTTQNSAIVTIEGEQKTTPKLSNHTSFNDLECPVTQISKSRYYLKSNKLK